MSNLTATREELEELKTLLSQLKTSDQNDSDMNKFQTELNKDCERKRQKNKQEQASETGKGFLSYLYNLSTGSSNYEDPVIDGDLDEYDDNLSIYEDIGSETKTIFRSKSYDMITQTPDTEDERDKIFSDDENDQKSDESSQSTHGFELDDFTDTFNLDNDVEDKEELKKEDSEVKATSTVSSDSTNRSGSLKRTKAEIENLTANSFYPSVSSGGSLQFSDVKMGDILGDLEGPSGIDKSETSEDILASISNKKDQLTFDENKLVDAIVNKLKKQLDPTLKSLSEIAGKYEMMKTLYKLPSISDLNEEVKIKYSSKKKNFNLEFHEDVIKTLINEETAKNQKRNYQINQSYIISANDQVRLNFNKFRQLNTIIEEKSFNDSYEENVPDRGRKAEIACKDKNYQKNKDNRKIESLSTDELVEYLNLLKNKKIQELNKVEHLVSLFEVTNENVINKMDNQQLKQAILSELKKRQII